MTPFHAFLGIMVAAVWGFNFVIITVALTGFPPILLTSVRFALAALLIVVLPKPDLPWRKLTAISAFLFLGQFGLLFFAMDNGMPPGLASVVIQAQAFLTIPIAAFALREMPKLRQIAGITVALVGLVLMSSTIGADVTWIGFSLTLAAAASWAVGNVLMRQSGGGGGDPLAVIVWLSIVPPLPLLALSWAFEGQEAILAALTTAPLNAVLALGYIVVISTLIGYGLWSFLLRRYSAASVSPFGLLVPIFGILSSSLFTDESFGLVRFAAMALVLLGLAIIAFPAQKFLRRAKTA